MPQSDQDYMLMALDEARMAADRGEVPVGALLIDSKGKIVARDGNRTIELNDPTAHAEILVMRRAGEVLENYRLLDTTLYVTIEPCVMCAGALVHARVSRLVFGADDAKAGGVISCYEVGLDGRLNHMVEVTRGVLGQECSLILKDFFRERRKK